MKNRIIPILYSIASFILIVTCALAVPILFLAYRSTQSGEKRIQCCTNQRGLQRNSRLSHTARRHISRRGLSIYRKRRRSLCRLQSTVYHQCHTADSFCCVYPCSACAEKTALHSDTLHRPISRRILCSRSLYRSDCAGGCTGKHGLLRSICHIPFYFLSRKRELDSKLSHRPYYQCHAAGFLYALCHINRRMYCHHLSGDYHLAGCTISKT